MIRRATVIAFVMEWIVTNISPWWVGLVLIGGLPAAAIGVQAVIRRKAPQLKQGIHNEVAGFLVAVIGVIYAVIVGFVIITLWSNLNTAQSTVNHEASVLSELPQGSDVLGASVHDQITQAAISYGQAVVAGWPATQRGQATIRTKVALDHLYTVFQSVKPSNEAQTAFVDKSMDRLNDLSLSRRARLLEAGFGGALPGVMWAAVIISSLSTLGFCLLFGLENARLHYAMMAGLGMLIGVNLFVVTQLQFPFSGTISAGPGPYNAAIHYLTAGL
jgi:hypothetical protein